MGEGGAIEQENNGRRAASPSAVCCKSLVGLGDNRKIGATGGRKTGEIEREIIVFFSVLYCSKSNLFICMASTIKKPSGFL